MTGVSQTTKDILAGLRAPAYYAASTAPKVFSHLLINKIVRWGGDDDDAMIGRCYGPVGDGRYLVAVVNTSPGARETEFEIVAESAITGIWSEETFRGRNATK